MMDEQIENEGKERAWMGKERTLQEKWEKNKKIKKKASDVIRNDCFIFFGPKMKT